MQCLFFLGQLHIANRYSDVVLGLDTGKFVAGHVESYLKKWRPSHPHPQAEEGRSRATGDAEEVGRRSLYAETT